MSLIVEGVFGVPDGFWCVKVCGDESSQGISGITGGCVVYALYSCCNVNRCEMMAGSFAGYICMCFPPSMGVLAFSMGCKVSF
jgi:hypothetical protein